MEQVTGRSGRTMERENLEIERRELIMSGRCINCNTKFKSQQHSLVCDACYEQVLKNLEHAEPGICPVCGGPVEPNWFYRKAYAIGMKPCSSKCSRVLKIVKHRQELEKERHHDADK